MDSMELRGTTPLLEVRDLQVHFEVGFDRTIAVNGVSYCLEAGSTLAIIGESGAGKSTCCRALIGLLPQTAAVSGSVKLDGAELIGLREPELRKHRGAHIAIAFQDAQSALNPTMRIGCQIVESIRANDNVDRRTARVRAVELLRRLGIAAPEERFLSYPHQLSGGMRQRVVIAVALAARPKVLIADEITRSLDSYTGMRIIELLIELQREFGMALILVSHDLKLVARCADYVLVMRAGWQVEYAPTDKLFTSPSMPYTRALVDAIRHR